MRTLAEGSRLPQPSARGCNSVAKLKASIKSVRAGLDQLESSFRLNPVLQSYYPNLTGVAGLAQTAENQAAANNFDQASRSLIAAINKLADVLTALC